MKAKLFFLDVMTIDSLPKDLPTLNLSHIWMHEDIKILLIFIRKMLHHPIFGQLLLDLENYNSCFEVLFCCCRTFLGLIVIIQAHFCLFVWRASWHFVQITQNLPMLLLWVLLLFWKGGGGHAKVDYHANYDMFAVPIPFQIFNLSAVSDCSKTTWYF